jgi:hypothetical protein
VGEYQDVQVDGGLGGQFAVSFYWALAAGKGGQERVAAVVWAGLQIGGHDGSGKRQLSRGTNSEGGCTSYLL